MPADRPLVLCASVHHHNTAAVARCIADELHADVVTPDEASATSLAGRGIVGFGSGVYYGGLHPALVGVIRGLPDAPEPTRPAFVFSTSGLPFLARLWHAPLRRLLARKGFRVVGEFACRGFDTWGPLRLAGGLNRRHPDGRDLARARAFARRMADLTPPARPAGP